MAVIKEEFVDWMRNPVTLEVLKSFKERKTALGDRLISDNGNIFDLTSYYKSLFIKGAIHAYDEFLRISFDNLISEEKPEDGK